MELDCYLDKKIQIVLVSGYTYIGKCISTSNNSLVLIDKNNSKVQIKDSQIEMIKELG